MKKIKQFLQCFIGILLMAAAICSCKYTADKPAAPDEKIQVLAAINALPDHDYISEIRQLIAEKKYGEAKILCEDIRKLDLPCAAELAGFDKVIEKESNAAWNRIYKAGRAFVTGEPDDSIEEISGSIASDMLMYGDIRDLIKQGWYKVTGKETDTLLVVLAGAGLATEFVDIADWAPAVFKAMKKCGAITAKLSASLVDAVKKMCRTRKMSGSTKTFFTGSKSMLDASGFIRTKNIFKNVTSMDEVAVLAKRSKTHPHLTHLTARHAGTETTKVIAHSTPEFLRHVARKGRYAIRFMKIYHIRRQVIAESALGKAVKKYLHRSSWLFAALGALIFLSGVLQLCFKRKNEAQVVLDKES